MNQSASIEDGIIDARRNPFIVSDWIKQRRRLTAHRQRQLEALFGKTVSEIKNDINRNAGKYPSFLAIRWGFAEIKDNKLMPTAKWRDLQESERHKRHPINIKQLKWVE